MVKWILSSLLLLNMAYAQNDRTQDSLGEALSQRKKTFSEKMPKDVVELYEKNIKELKASGLEKKTLKVGDKVPDVEVSLGGQKHPLSHIYATGPLVLKFYRGGWCSYCLAELKHYQKLHPEFKKAGSQILAISPDTNDMSKKTKGSNELDFDVVSDEGHKMARKFGLVYRADSKVVTNLKKNGIDIAQFQGNDANELSIPATYVVGKDGRISFAFIDADYRVRAEPSLVLEAVKKTK